MSAAARLRHRVISTRVEGVAAQQPPDRETGSPERAVPRHRLQGVRAARRVEPTAGRQRRAYPTTVRDDGHRQHAGTECRGPWRRSSALTDRRSAAWPLRRGERRVEVGAEPVRTTGRPPPGSARTTRVVPAGSVASRSRTRCRSRRRTLLRTTAPPTALETTKPARAGAVSCSAPAGRRLGSTVAAGDGRSGGRRRRRGRHVGRRGPRRRSRRYAAVAARRPARLPTSRTGPGRPQADRRVAALGAAGGEDGAAGTGAHAQPEAVGLRAPAVVRLVGALAHVRLSVFVRPRSVDRGRVVVACGRHDEWPTVDAARSARPRAR